MIVIPTAECKRLNLYFSTYAMLVLQSLRRNSCIEIHNCPFFSLTRLCVLHIKILDFFHIISFQIFQHMNKNNFSFDELNIFVKFFVKTGLLFFVLN